MPKAVKRKAALDKTELRLDKILKTSPTKKRHRRKRHGSGPSEQLTLRRAATITVEENDSSDDTHASGLISDAATGTSRNTPIDLDTVCSFILKDGNSTQMLKIPSGLTKLALQTGETINTLNVPQFDLIDQVDDEEMATALESLKSIPKSSTAAKSVQRQGDSSTRLISGEAIRQNTRTDLDTVCSFISKEDNSRTQMFKIPSGLTKLALSPGDTINTQSDLIDPIGDDEIAMALESLKTKLKVDASTLSTEAVQRLSKSSASDTTEPGLKAVTNRKKQRVNIKGATSSTSHRRVSRPKRHIRKPNKFSTEYSFKMSKPVPKKKPVVQTSKMDKGIKNNKQLQASTTIQKLQEKPAMKTVGMTILVL